MAAKEYKILRSPDDFLFKHIIEISTIVNLQNGANCNIEFGPQIQNISGNSLINIGKSEEIKNILNLKSFYIDTILINVPQPNPNNIVRSIAFKRIPDSYDKINIEFNNCPYLTAIKISEYIYKNFTIYNPILNMEKSLGDELSDFYRRREENILNLENLSQKLIQQNEEYRRKIDQDLLNEKSKLKENIEKKEVELFSKIEKQKENLDAREKELDDRKSTHARRQLRNDIKQELKNRSEKFNLTKTTMRKRLPIHVLFLFIIFFILVFLSVAFWKELPTNSSSYFFEVYYYIRLSILGISLVVTVIFYIHWNDRWAQAHADEEFRLKRLDLDIDRASWIVEMAMEWQNENKNELPKDLLDKLSNNLFSNKESSGITEHPYEEFIKMLLSVSAEAKIPIPGGGEIKIDKQGMKSLAKSNA